LTLNFLRRLKIDDHAVITSLPIICFPFLSLFHYSRPSLILFLFGSVC